MKYYIRSTAMTILILFCNPGLNHAQARINPGKTNARRLDITEFDVHMMSPNNIDLWLNNDGEFGSNNSVSPNPPGCYYPAGQTERNLIYSAGIWIAGQVDRQIRSSIAMYTTEFQSGTIMADGSPSEESDSAFRIFSINKGDEIPQDMIDQGGPGTIMGDQMSFCVFNDLINRDPQLHTPALGLEIKQTFWGYRGMDLLDNVIIMKYEITNKGSQVLKDLFFGVWTDHDIGSANDDYMGCDVLREMGYAYNGDPEDDQYGTTPPCLGILQLQGPIVPSPGQTATLPDNRTFPDSKVLGMASFGPMVCGAQDPGMSCPTPQDTQKLYNFLQGLNGLGQPWIDPTVKNNAETTFPLSGDPVTGTGWTQSMESQPRDGYMLVGTGPVNMNPGDEQELVFALIVGQGTDNLNSITRARNVADAARAFYQNDWTGIEEDGPGAAASNADDSEPVSSFELYQNYPNPFNPETTISFLLNQPAAVVLSILDLQGQEVSILVNEDKRAGSHSVMWDSRNKNGFQVASGIYIYRMMTRTRDELSVQDRKLLLVR